MGIGLNLTRFQKPPLEGLCKFSCSFTIQFQKTKQYNTFGVIKKAEICSGIPVAADAAVGVADLSSVAFVDVRTVQFSWIVPNSKK